MQEIISIKKLNKGFLQATGERLEILRNLDFVVKENSFVSIIGHSGSGKSTLLHMLGLLDEPCSVDEWKLCGSKIEQMSLAERTRFRGEKLGFIFQFHQLLPEFTALQNVMLPMRIMGVSQTAAKKRAMELLSKVFSTEEMDNKVYARREAQLSGGQCQRVAIARALANDPPLIFADEPTGSLDPESAVKVMEILKALPAEGKAVVMITHQMELAAEADHIYALLAGQLVDKTSDIKQRLSGTPKKSKERHCPICQDGILLDEIEYQKGVLIDQCPQCNGVWLDKGELEMVSINVDAFCDEVENIAFELRNTK